MDEFKKVSVLMPAKNAAKYLDSCIQSILAQSYPHWELLVCNDHSEDETLAILTQFASQDSRIKVFQNQGHGIIDGLATVYAHASGHFISRMDADDLMTPDKLLRLVSACDAPNVVATGKVAYFSEQSLGEGYIKYADWLNENLQSSDPFQAIYKECVIPSPCWMMHKSTLDEIGAFTIDRYPEDYDLVFRMRRHGLKVKTVDVVLHHWRDYPERSSRTDPNYADNRFMDLKVYYFLLDDYDVTRPLFLWGAGKKGKLIARLLQEKGIAFHWISDNPKKIGHNIYDVIIADQKQILDAVNAQVIICIAGPDDQAEMQHLLSKKPSVVTFWFC